MAGWEIHHEWGYSNFPRLLAKKSLSTSTPILFQQGFVLLGSCTNQHAQQITIGTPPDWKDSRKQKRNTINNCLRDLWGNSLSDALRTVRLDTVCVELPERLSRFWTIFGFTSSYRICLKVNMFAEAFRTCNVRKMIPQLSQHILLGPVKVECVPYQHLWTINSTQREIIRNKYPPYRG